MALRSLFIAVVGATVLAWSGLSVADEYRPDEFLGLDLSTAVLSPNPLGPATSFTPGPLDVTVDRGSNRVRASAEPTAEPKSASNKIVVHNTRVARPRAEPPRHSARTKLARHHRSPLDAQAFDARIQVWPCTSGSICKWKR